MTTVAGLVFGGASVVTVQVVVDGTASYGAPRPDIPATFPNAPLNVSFTYSLDTGANILNVPVTDSSGNLAIFANRSVTISK